MQRASLVALGTACSLAACTFPEINLYVTTSDGGASTSASANGGASGSTSTTTNSGAAGGQGGSAGEAGGGNGGEGASMCNGGGGMGGGGGVGGVDPCNKDGDPHLAMGFPCCGDDCDDENPDVYPTQQQHFDVALPNGTYDYDCDDKDEGDPDQLFNGTGNVVCSGLLCVNGEEGYSDDANCGLLDVGQHFKCEAVTCAVLSTQPKEPLRCK
jgi:hypothetical protein